MLASGKTSLLLRRRMNQRRKRIKCEIWKDVPGYEGLYQVSNMGNIKSLSHYARNNKKGGLRLTEGRILSQYKMPNGYMQVQFSKNEGREKVYVHRIVAMAFLSNENGFSDVNHIDGNKENNSVDNLEWCSHRSNQIHMIQNRMTKKAIPVLCVESGEVYNSMTEAEKKKGVDRHFIKKACESGNVYKGYHWRYVV